MPVSPYTHKRVRHSEQFIRDLIDESLTPIKNNVENVLDVDLITTLGKVDVQYTTYNSPFIDFISVLKHKEHCVNQDGSRNHPIFWQQVRNLNGDIKTLQNLGYTIQEIYECLGQYASRQLTPGKFMNPNYDFVAYVQYEDKQSYEVKNYYILDLNVLRNYSSEGVNIAFNIKNKWNSLNDFHHSAYLKFPPNIIRLATVTQKFISLDPSRV